MKSTLHFLFVFIMAASLLSCKKRKEIIYPSSMIYGDNVLAIESIVKQKRYSFGAKLGKKATLKIVITNLSLKPKSTLWFYSNAQGWVITDYGADGIQTFVSNKDGDVILEMLFQDSPGSCKVEYYENSSKVTKTKYLYW